jgi:NADH-quinone oxidoreductase subunit M
MIILLGTIALPLTNGFIGEFMLLLGLFKFNPWITLFAATTIIFSAVYMLRMYQNVMLGPSPDRFIIKQEGLSAYELAALFPLVILVFWIGCYPKSFLDLAGPAIKTLLNLSS